MTSYAGRNSSDDLERTHGCKQNVYIILYQVFSGSLVALQCVFWAFAVTFNAVQFLLAVFALVLARRVSDAKQQQHQDSEKNTLFL